MLQERRDAANTERLAEARRLAAQSRVDDLRALVTDFRMRAGVLSADDEVFLGSQLAVAQYTRDRPGAARGELDLVRPLVPNASMLRQAQFYATSGAVAFRLDNHEVAIRDTVLALAAVEGEQDASEDLAVVTGACALNQAHTQLFLLAAETAEHAIDIARRAGCPLGPYEFQAAYANVCWAMRLQHLGRTEESRDRWQLAADRMDSALADASQLTVVWQVHATVSRAYCAAQLGDPAGARGWLDAAALIPLDPLTPDLRRLLAHVNGAVLLAEGHREQAREALLDYWSEASQRNLPPWTEDGAWLLAQVAEADGDSRTALEWYRQVHERYGRAQYEVWMSRATAARLRVEQETLLRRTRQLESDAMSDPLTGVANRRSFDEVLPRLVADAHSTGSALAMAIVDVDRFKRVNDTYGHQIGDEVLRRVARILREHSRATDHCARFGGDEFVLCLRLDPVEAAAVVSRIGHAVGNYAWSAVIADLAVTVTTGLAELRYDDTAASLFWKADQSLLAAKRARPPRPDEQRLRLPDEPRLCSFRPPKSAT